LESAQRELLSVLLRTVYDRGLLSKATYLRAVDLVHSGIAVPPLFRYPVCRTKEAEQCEYP
jgi:hypothetical protein